MSDLEQFVLDYVQEAGGLVEPPAYGVYEALLPEPVARRWRIPAYLQLTFAETERGDAFHLGYNHPLVEQMVQEAHGRTASARLYINDLRLDKSGIDDLAVKSWVILNGRAQLQKRATSSRVCHTYIRFNFKAAILSDEKQERLVSVLMDAHTGSRVANAGLIESRATAVAPDVTLASLPAAPLRWQRQKDGPPLKAPLAETTLQALLEQAQTAILQEMQADLAALQKRVSRFHLLDEARLTDYYNSLEKDLRARLQTASADRQPGLQDKLTAVQTERRHKLADLAERYQVQINLTLLNLLVIQQPKIIQPVEIANRSTRISVYAVYDPLLRQLEPLHCQVCGQPGHRLYLCHNGHLAHEECLAPACIDCKRVFCGDCAHEVDECAVCRQPLCRHSQMICPTCGRHTCQAHRELCHANDGRPVALTVPTVAAPAAPPPVAKTPAPAPAAPKGKTPPAKTKPKVIPAPPKPQLPKGTPKPVRMEVILHHNAVAAYLLGKRDREIATRVWELVPEEGGILRNCTCEKGAACRADGMILRPFEVRFIEKQMKDELAAFAAEYYLPLSKIHYNRLSSLNGQPYGVGRFELFGLWKNEEALAEARAAFARL